MLRPKSRAILLVTLLGTFGASGTSASPSQRTDRAPSQMKGPNRSTFVPARGATSHVVTNDSRQPGPAAASHGQLWRLQERQWQEASLRRAQYQAARAHAGSAGTFSDRDTTLMRSQKSMDRARSIERRAARKLKYDA